MENSIRKNSIEKSEQEKKKAKLVGLRSQQLKLTAKVIKEMNIISIIKEKRGIDTG